MTTPVDQLLTILDLEPLEHNLFRGRTPQGGWKRIFGGQVIGQALVAACRTVDGRRPHSLHAYFILPGDPKVPVIYEVARIRDGRSFTTRNVLAIQHGEVIFSMSVSFHMEEPGFSHQIAMPDVPGPDDLPGTEAMKTLILPGMPEAIRAHYARERPIELRPVDMSRYLTQTPAPASPATVIARPEFNVWIRATQRLPDDPLLHQCILAYASDMMLLDTSLIAHGRSVFDKGMQPASLDHALWFHRPFRADEWLLYCQDSPSSSGARGFARGLVFTRSGELVASVAQEGLVRHRPDLA